MGLWWFLISLGVFFAAALVGYAVVFSGGRLLGGFRPPWTLWVSTLLLMAAGAALHLSLRFVQRERPRAFKRSLAAAFALGLAFCGVQGFACAELLQRHQQILRSRPVAELVGQAVGNVVINRPPDAGTPASAFGTAVVLVAGHAFHVLGGVVALAVVGVRALLNRYDHEYYFGVKVCTAYWHFLDLVWLAMLAVLLLVR